MGAVFSSTEGALLLIAIAVAAYLGSGAIRPKPLAGIPYNRDGAAKLFGDVPEMMGFVMKTGQVFGWLTSLTERHQSPIVQAFVKPGSLPWVVLTDPLESQDILLRRTKEFDRSGFFGELIGGILPEQHIQFLSSDSRFKNNRNLINHLMAPTFITTVSAPEMYKSILTLIKVWQAKCEITKGRPFSAHHDVTYAALDGIFASSFGLPEADSNTIQRLEAVEQWTPELPSNPDEPVPFPEGKVPLLFSSVLTLANSVTDTQLSPAPVLTSWVLRKLPYMVKATAVKDEYIRAKVRESEQFISQGVTQSQSALHSVLMREKERAIADEFFGFMMAGHDTSATAVAWGVKFLTEAQDKQDKLRAALRAGYTAAAREGRAPTYEELIKTPIPYLDAAVEEILRHANTIAFVVREAQQDTTVLGRHIPKGTNVFLMANGAGYLKPNLRLGDADRSVGARRAEGKSLTGTWDDADVSAFRPERWLKEDGTFDPQAGPQLAFGLGPRGCFGRKLAMLTLKMQFALIVWHFQLLPTPAELSGKEAVQRFALEPKQCYIRLEKAEI
ncbi:uncharacterized protein PG986_003630 [Apiospora aurea]|uniref:Cytochrome P450 monooxygenase n=1 Tax=Apiospora aurea TaxID=335848 RepID=A0ABR1QS74_9PEZI